MPNKKKRVLFIVYHPVEPHIYYQISKKFDKRFFEVRFAFFESEGIIEKITRSYNISFYKIGKAIKNKFFRILLIPIILVKLIIIYLRFRPKVIFSATSPYAGLSAFVSGIPIIGWSDTETATFNNNLSSRYFNTIILPETFYETIKSDRIIKYNGYKELVYLHPNVFKPDRNLLKELNISEKDKIILMRFSALQAMHDIGLESEVLSNDDKILEFIKGVEKKYNARIFISITERNLDSRFDKYKLSIDPSKYIHLLSFCSLYIGEGTTTASEAGVLGIPWINIQKTKRGYLIDQEENYGLGLRTEDIDFAFIKAEEFLSDENRKEKWQKKRKKLLTDKIDVASFLAWFIENYPQSHAIMQENPDYQDRFR